MGSEAAQLELTKASPSGHTGWGDRPGYKLLVGEGRVEERREQPEGHWGTQSRPVWAHRCIWPLADQEENTVEKQIRSVMQPGKPMES